MCVCVCVFVCVLQFSRELVKLTRLSAQVNLEPLSIEREQKERERSFEKQKNINEKGGRMGCWGKSKTAVELTCTFYLC